MGAASRPRSTAKCTAHVVAFRCEGVEGSSPSRAPSSRTMRRRREGRSRTCTSRLMRPSLYLLSYLPWGIRPESNRCISGFTDRRSTFEPRTPCPVQDSNLHPSASQAAAHPLSFQGVFRWSGGVVTRNGVLLAVTMWLFHGTIPPIHRVFVREPEFPLDAISLQLSKSLCGPGRPGPSRPEGCCSNSFADKERLRHKERPPVRAA